jgi:hypothetical protein
MPSRMQTTELSPDRPNMETMMWTVEGADRLTEATS